MPNRAARYTQAFTAAAFAAMVEGPRSVLRVVQNGRLIHDHARLSWAEAFAQFFHSPVDIQLRQGLRTLLSARAPTR